MSDKRIVPQMGDSLKKFRKHETVNLIRLKQTVKANTMDDDQNEHTEETIKRAEKDLALDLPMLVDETARNLKILSAIAILEKTNQKTLSTHIVHAEIT